MGILRMYHSRYDSRNRTFIRGGRVADGTVVWKIKDVRCPYSLGEFVFKMNEPKDYEYLLLCDGSTISEENYPELVAVLGRTQLPNLIDRFLQGSVTAGTYKEAGLPDIEGNIAAFNNYWFAVANRQNGALYTNNPTFTDQSRYANMASTVMDSGRGANIVSFAASKSNSIYGSSTTVQPPAFTAKIYICYAG